MKRLIIFSVISVLTISGCAANNSPVNSPVLVQSHNLNSAATKLRPVSSTSFNTLTDRITTKSLISKPVKSKNSLVRKPVKSLVTVKSNQQHLNIIKTALQSMDKAKTYNEAVATGRKAAMTVLKDLTNTNDPHYDMKYILDVSLVYARVQQQDPKNYDDSSLVNEYKALDQAFQSLIQSGAGSGGHPHNLAIVSYNLMINIMSDDTMGEYPRYRDAFYTGVFALTFYSKKAEYKDYHKIASDTLASLDYDNDTVKELYEKVFKVIDVISGAKK